MPIISNANPIANVVFDSKLANDGIISANAPKITTKIPKFFILFIFLFMSNLCYKGNNNFLT